MAYTDTPIKIPGRLQSVAADGIVADASAIYDISKEKYINQINDDLEALVERAEAKAQTAIDMGSITVQGGSLSVDTEPTENHTTAVVTSAGLYNFLNTLMVQLTQDEYDNLSEETKNNGSWYFIEEE